MSGRRVLITGASGLIGSVLRDGLGGSYDVTGVDLRRAQGVRRANVRSLRSLLPHVAGRDAIVDLAANPSVRASWRDVRRTNLVAPFNVLEAARRQGIRRVVFASSNHVTGLYERDSPYAQVLAGRYDGLSPEELPRLRSDAAIRPDSLYGAAKAFGESLCRHYAEEHGVSTICLRIGTVNREDRARSPRDRATLLTHRDLVHLVDCCLRAPADLRFAIFYGVSANTWRIWDIDEARDAIGYAPQDDAGRSG